MLCLEETMISVWNSFTEEYDVLDFYDDQWWCITSYPTQQEADNHPDPAYNKSLEPTRES